MPDTPATSAPTVGRSALRRGLDELRAGVGLSLALCRRVAFWLAVLLPLTYPYALATARGTLPALLVVHAAAVALGHDHRPD